MYVSRNGYNMSEGLAQAERAAGAAPAPGSLRAAPELAHYLETLQQNTSAGGLVATGANSFNCYISLAHSGQTFVYK